MAAQGYAIHRADEDAMETMGNDASEHHPTQSHGDPKDNTPPKPNEQDLGSECSDHPEGKQYDPDNAGEYHFDSEGDLEPIYLWATQIIMTSALNQIDSWVAKASKPMPPKPPIVESN